MPHRVSFKERFSKDFPASVVVFLVALPLCLGIAFASGAPAFAGIISGIVGGIVIGYLSGSHLSVSGPAAGLTVVVLDSIKSLGSFEVFLTAVMLAGVFQILMGLLKAGVLANFFPSSVIKGMLASIGLLLIFKQLPHGLGYDFDYQGNESFEEGQGHNTFTDIYNAILEVRPGALIITVASLLIMLVWDNNIKRFNSFFKLIPGALLAVGVGVILNLTFTSFFPANALSGDQLVTLPTRITQSGLGDLIVMPDFAGFANVKVYGVAITIALIASIESLLSVEAIDKLDPHHRVTPLNRELLAQGTGNIVAGMIGGIPLTAVIVRSSANLVAGASSKLSAILHGVLLLLSVLTFPILLNYIPLAALAAVLLIVGYKLTKPSLFAKIYRQGIPQFLPFIITIVAILLTNLLVGIGIGLAVGLGFVLISNFHRSITIVADESNYLIRLRYNVSFLNKTLLRNTLMNIPEKSHVIIDGTNASFIDHDIVETIENYEKSAMQKNITVEIKRSNSSLNDFFRN